MSIRPILWTFLISMLLLAIWTAITARNPPLEYARQIDQAQAGSINAIQSPSYATTDVTIHADDVNAPAQQYIQLTKAPDCFNEQEAETVDPNDGKHAWPDGPVLLDIWLNNGTEPLLSPIAMKRMHEVGYHHVCLDPFKLGTGDYILIFKATFNYGYSVQVTARSMRTTDEAIPNTIWGPNVVFSGTSGGVGVPLVDIDELGEQPVPPAIDIERDSINATISPRINTDEN